MPCKSELKQFPTPTTAILILFIYRKPPKLDAAAGSGQESCHNIAIFAERNPGGGDDGNNINARFFGLSNGLPQGILIEKPYRAGEIEPMRLRAAILIFSWICATLSRAAPTYTVEQAVATARKQNAEILMAAK